MSNNRFEPLGLGVGTIINSRYDVVRKLGAGGMSAVYQVVDRALNNDLIALKLFEPRLTGDEVLLERFRNEVLITRKLTHPNIVRTYDFGEAQGRYYFMTMEHVHGVTLEKLIHAQSTGTLSVLEGFKVLSEVLKGMSYAHSMGVIHRDLKPANVLISETGEVKITDFGLARTLEITNRFTQAGECVGTPYYMAPEQIQEKNIDVRSDLYSVGIMAYELITGQVPFSDKSWFNLASKIVKEPLPPVVVKKGKVPVWLQEFIDKATAKNKEDRFSSADEMREVLEVCMQGELDNTIIHLPTLPRNTARHLARNTIIPGIAHPEVDVTLLSRLSLAKSMYRLAPLLLLVSLIALAGIAAIGLGGQSLDKVSQELQQNTSGMAQTLNEFTDTLDKLQKAVVTIHQNKDEIDHFLDKNPAPQPNPEDVRNVEPEPEPFSVPR